MNIIPYFELNYYLNLRIIKEEPFSSVMGGTSCADLLVHPLGEPIAGDQHPLADLQRGEVLPVQQIVGVGAGDAQNIGKLGGVEHQGQIAEGRDGRSVVHDDFSFSAVHDFGIQL